MTYSAILLINHYMYVSVADIIFYADLYNNENLNRDEGHQSYAPRNTYFNRPLLYKFYHFFLNDNLAIFIITSFFELAK